MSAQDNPVLCRSCGAVIIWALTPSGRRQPLNTPPEKRIVLVEAGCVARVVDTYTAHHATCPQAAAWRRTGAL